MILNLPDHYVRRVIAIRAAQRQFAPPAVKASREIDARAELDQVFLCIKHSNGVKVSEIIEKTGIKRSRVEARIAELKQRADGYTVSWTREGQSMIYFAA